MAFPYNRYSMNKGNQALDSTVCRLVVCVLGACVLSGCGGGPGAADGPPPPPPSITVNSACVFPASGTGLCWPYAIAGQGGFTIQVTGSGFTNSSIVEWNGTPLSGIVTAFSSSTDIFATVSSSKLTSPGKASISVTDHSVGSNSVAFSIASPATATAGVVQLVSAAPDGSPANGDSIELPTTSATGRYVTFESNATNLAPGPASGYEEIYERDTCVGAPSGCAPTTVRVTVTYDGSSVNAHTLESAISADGRYVAFASRATNILPGSVTCGGGATECVYLRDTCIGAATGCAPATFPVSVNAQGAIAPGAGPRISPDGRFVSFASIASKLGIGSATTSDVFLRDTCDGGPTDCTPTTTQLSFAGDGGQGNDISRQGDISSNGRFVGFLSDATNMVPNEGFVPGIFWRDTCWGAGSACTPTTLRADVANDGSQPNSGLGALMDLNVPITADGRLVAFGSAATNLVSTNINANCPMFQGVGCSAVFVRDTCTGAPSGCAPSTSLASLANDGSTGNCSSPGNVGGLTMSAGGRYVAFGSIATNLTPDDTFPACGYEDIFVRDTCFGAASGCVQSTVRASVANYAGPGVSGNNISNYSAISADGHYIVFVSAATNFLPTPSNGHAMVWLAKSGF